jgi:hypothetical protein
MKKGLKKIQQIFRGLTQEVGEIKIPYIDLVGGRVK